MFLSYKVYKRFSMVIFKCVCEHFSPFVKPVNVNVIVFFYSVVSIELYCLLSNVKNVSEPQIKYSEIVVEKVVFCVSKLTLRTMSSPMYNLGCVVLGG